MVGCDSGANNSEGRIPPEVRVAVDTGPCGDPATYFSGSILALGANGKDWGSTGWQPDESFIEYLDGSDKVYIYVRKY